MPDFHYGRGEHSKQARNGSRAANGDPTSAHFDRVDTQDLTPAWRRIDPGPERLPYLPDFKRRLRSGDRRLFRAGLEKVNHQTRRDPTNKRNKSPLRR